MQGLLKAMHCQLWEVYETDTDGERYAQDKERRGSFALIGRTWLQALQDGAQVVCDLTLQDNLHASMPFDICPRGDRRGKREGAGHYAVSMIHFAPCSAHLSRGRSPHGPLTRAHFMCTRVERSLS